MVVSRGGERRWEGAKPCPWGEGMRERESDYGREAGALRGWRVPSLQPRAQCGGGSVWLVIHRGVGQRSAKVCACWCEERPDAETSNGQALEGEQKKRQGKRRPGDIEICVGGNAATRRRLHRKGRVQGGSHCGHWLLTIAGITMNERRNLRRSADLQWAHTKKEQPEKWQDPLLREASYLVDSLIVDGCHGG